MKENKDIKKDTLLWFVEKSYNEYVKCYGIVNEVWHDGVELDLLCFKNKEVINGTPIHSIAFPTKPVKLPKGWTYKTDLINKTYDYTEDELNFMHNKLSDDVIREGLKNGCIVRRCDEPYYYGHVVSDIDKGMYSLKWEYPTYAPRWQSQTSIFIAWKDLFETKDAAEKYIADIVSENERIANLSDHDYNIEILDGLLQKCIAIYHMTKQECEKLKTEIISLSDFDDLEFRLCGGGIQFKNYNKKKWLMVGGY